MLDERTKPRTGSEPLPEILEGLGGRVKPHPKVLDKGHRTATPNVARCNKERVVQKTEITPSNPLAAAITATASRVNLMCHNVAQCELDELANIRPAVVKSNKT